MWFFKVIIVENPPDPYSIKKCPEPQICQKFVPTIVFRGSNQGDPNFSKICQKFEKRQFFAQIFEIFDKFLTNLGPPDWNAAKQSSGQMFDEFGVRAFLNAARGRRVRKIRVAPLQNETTPKSLNSKTRCHMKTSTKHPQDFKPRSVV